MSSALEHWDLDSFLDSLILELDKAQDTLSVKGVTRKLTYAVRDVALDLHVFPSYQDGELNFSNARPGDSGASKLSIQLGSITDRQIRETTNEPLTRDEISIESLEGVNDTVKDSLRKIGVNSSRDLERLERQNVDLPKVVRKKNTSAGAGDFNRLANLIKNARRGSRSPALSRIRSIAGDHREELVMEGSDLVLDRESPNFPLARINGIEVDVLMSNENEVRLAIPNEGLRRGSNRLEVALDSQSLLTVDVEG